MHKTAALLRHRELTQEIYNIGDEVAEYIEHIAEAIADYDGELTEECLAEFSEIVGDARQDSRRVVGELIGLRQALTSGMRAGFLSAGARPEEKIPEPELLDATGLRELFPLAAPFSVRTMHDALAGRTELTAEHLSELVDYALEQTDMVARELSAVSLPHLYARVGELVEAAVAGWVETVCRDHPAFTRTMRGMNPPPFLAERARIDAIVAKVAAKRSRRGA
ncbi:hypothetical protein CAPI_03400 [Corynebacterium capitovis DSM 44611]|uniref:hypothetical protein n=1 Tax=Corynebacterium capitovis TaxID=131081 RepID=UPI000379C65D|nr:hypothetical protein [Corynebacterium capitovis]WKD57242.1 hypothetical protein CAPI_03400 [Corynebacterium capitovis DSM 44611]